MIFKKLVRKYYQTESDKWFQRISYESFYDTGYFDSLFEKHCEDFNVYEPENRKEKQSIENFMHKEKI